MNNCDNCYYGDAPCPHSSICTTVTFNGEQLETPSKWTPIVEQKELEEISEKITQVGLSQIYSKEDIKEGLKKMAEHDNVNHPAHYERKGAIECIDEMVMIFGRQAVMDFCKCNAWKYRYRAADKNGSEDIAKSDWYMCKYKELAGESIKDNFIQF